MPPNKLWCKEDIGDETEADKKEINLHKYAYVTMRSRVMVETAERKYRFIMMGKVKAQTTAANCSPFARVPTATPLSLPHPHGKTTTTKKKGGGEQQKKMKMNGQTANPVLLP